MRPNLVADLANQAMQYEYEALKNFLFSCVATFQKQQNVFLVYPFVDLYDKDWV